MTFALETTAIYREVQKIFGDGSKPISSYITAQIHANGKTIEVMKVIEFHRVRNYLVNFFDEIYLDILMLPGDYIFDIEPYRTNIEITISKLQLTEMMGSEDLDREPETERYKAVLIKNTSEAMTGNRIDRQDRELANRAGPDTYSFQLIDRASEKIRTISTGGIFRNTSAALVAKTLLGDMSKDILIDNERAVFGVDMAPKFSDNVRNHVVVPQHTPLHLIPKRLHDDYGIYGAGFWYYLQNNYWYLYAPYDTTRYSSASKTLTVVNVPSNRLPNVERTYRETQTQVLIIGTGETKHIDFSETDQINEGNAIRFVDADTVTESFIIVDGNRTKANMRSNIQECVADVKTDSINYVSMSPNKISSNSSFEKSRIARRKGSFIRVVWENSNDSILFPSMPLKYVYEIDGGLNEVFGCLVGVETLTKLQGPAITTNRHLNKTILTLFVENVVRVAELY